MQHEQPEVVVVEFLRLEGRLRRKTAADSAN